MHCLALCVPLLLSIAPTTLQRRLQASACTHIYIHVLCPRTPHTHTHARTHLPSCSASASTLVRPTLPCICTFSAVPIYSRPESTFSPGIEHTTTCANSTCLLAFVTVYFLQTRSFSFAFQLSLTLV
jgi:hypothetical protein